MYTYVFKQNSNAGTLSNTRPDSKPTKKIAMAETHTSYNNGRGGVKKQPIQKKNEKKNSLADYWKKEKGEDPNKGHCLYGGWALSPFFDAGRTKKSVTVDEERTDKGETKGDHHIINWSSCLLPWIKEMSKAYNATRKHLKGSHDHDFWALTSQQHLGAAMKSVGVPIGADGAIDDDKIQADYVWRKGNIMVGIRPEWRSDDPGKGNEWETAKPTEKSTAAALSEGKIVWEHMKKVQKQIPALMTSEVHKIEEDDMKAQVKIKSWVITSKKPRDVNDDWAAKTADHWGFRSPGGYKLK